MRRTTPNPSAFSPAETGLYPGFAAR